MGSIYRPKYRTRDGTLKPSSVWWIMWKAHGKVYRESARINKESEARRQLKQREGAVVEGRPVMPLADKVRVKELAEDLVNDYEASRRPALERLRYSFKHLLPFFGHMRASRVTPADMSRYIARRQEIGASNGTIDWELFALRRMFSLGLASKKILCAQRFPRLRVDNVHQGFFEEPTFQQVCKHLPEYARHVAIFGYITGWRLYSEILSLR